MNSNGLDEIDKRVVNAVKPPQSVNDVKQSQQFQSSGLANVASVNLHKIHSKFLLVDTKPDYNIEWSESYQCDSWKDAYEKMVHLVIETSPNTLESNLVNSNAVINPYSAQTFDESGVRHVYHIMGI